MENDDTAARTETAGPAVRAALRIELASGERQTVATFRDGILRWLNDRSGNGFARVLGSPDQLSFEEVRPSGDGIDTPVVRLEASWFEASEQRSFAVARPALPATPGPDGASVQTLVFFPDSPDQQPPIFGDFEVPFALTGLGPLLPHRPDSTNSDVQPRFREAGAASLVRSARRVVRSLDGTVLGLRLPAAVGARRLKGFALLGAAAAVFGFMVGTIYLTGPRARQADEPSVVSSDSIQGLPGSEQVAAVSAAAAERTPVPAGRERSGGDVLAPVPVAAPAPRLEPAARRNGIADTEVTPAPRLRARPRPELRRPNPVVPVVVRAREETSAAGSSTAGRGSGTLVVGSDPQGADVSVNGIPHGRTPLMIRGLSSGSRVIRLDLPGYRRWSWAVSVVANKQTPVTVKLQPEARRAGSPGVD